MTTKIFAHRGASKYAPENTMSAFRLASELGADGIETDVHLTKDQIPVLIHDETLKRTTNQTGFVKDFTFKQLQEMDAGAWFSNQFQGERIISLEHFLTWVHPKNISINIELKNNKIDYAHIETIVYLLLEKYRLLDRSIISTFNPNSIKRLEKYNDSVEVALLTSKKNKYIVQDSIELGATALHIKYTLLNKRLMYKANKKDLKIRVYTINKIAHMKRCFAAKCHAIITDVPDIAIKQRTKR